MALTLDGNTGVSLVQDGVVTAADLASTLDLTGKTVTLPAGVGGKVLQVVLGPTRSGRFQSTSTSYVDTGYLITITPTSASSKVFIGFSMATNVSTNGSVLLALYKNGSMLNGENGHSSMSDVGRWSQLNGFDIDSPNTTSAVTYNIYGKTSSGTLTIGWSSTVVGHNLCFMYAMEIAA